VLKVVLVGDRNTGKTSLMKRFERNSFNNLLKFTVVVDFLEKDVTVDRETYTLQIWDTAGQERYKSVTRPFFKGADCCLLTFALDDMRSFENLSQWKRKFLHNAGIPDGKTFPFVIVGNKVDDVDNRKVDEMIVRDWCKQNGIEFDLYYETSAKDDTNVDEDLKLQ
jgi:small GTP-binding protein